MKLIQRYKNKCLKIVTDFLHQICCSVSEIQTICICGSVVMDHIKKVWSYRILVEEHLGRNHLEDLE